MKKRFTCIAVSSNINSFGYRSTLWACEDGTGFKALVQALGLIKMPAVGESRELDIRSNDTPDTTEWSYTVDVLPTVAPKLAKAAIADAKQHEVMKLTLRVERTKGGGLCVFNDSRDREIRAKLYELKNWVVSSANGTTVRLCPR